MRSMSSIVGSRTMLASGVTDNPASTKDATIASPMADVASVREPHTSHSRRPSGRTRAASFATPAPAEDDLRGAQKVVSNHC